MTVLWNSRNNHKKKRPCVLDRPACSPDLAAHDGSEAAFSQGITGNLFLICLSHSLSLLELNTLTQWSSPWLWSLSTSQILMWWTKHFDGILVALQRFKVICTMSFHDVSTKWISVNLIMIVLMSSLVCQRGQNKRMSWLNKLSLKRKRGNDRS